MGARSAQVEAADSGEPITGVAEEGPPRDVIGNPQQPTKLDEIVALWLATAFEGGRHQRRLDQIAAIEREEDAGHRQGYGGPGREAAAR